MPERRPLVIVGGRRKELPPGDTLPGSAVFDPLNLAVPRIGLWLPPGNSNAIGSPLGITTITGTGTATARNVASTRYFTRVIRLGYVSAATAAALCGARIATANLSMGASSTPVIGGFRTRLVFGCSDAATVAGARQFAGISTNVAAPTNVEPSTLTNSIGIGHGAADTNLKLYFGGSTAQTPIDLGVNFPANTLSVDMYQLDLNCAAGVNNAVGWKVVRLNTGDTASGTLTAATPGTQLPLNTNFLTPMQAWRTNNATLLAVGLDFGGLSFAQGF